MPVAIPEVLINQFTMNAETYTLVAEDSDLGSPMFRTGTLAIKLSIAGEGGYEFRVAHTEVRDGDVCWWDLKPAEPIEGINGIRIFND